MKISETYIIDFDISDGEDKSVMMVTRTRGGYITAVNEFKDKEAERLYEKITGKKLGSRK